MPLPKIRTEHQIQAEISMLKVKLDSLESWLHAEPWNSEVRQDFRSTQNRLNSLLSEIASL